MFNGRDEQIWRCSASGEFNVRCAYHLANSSAKNDKGECSYSSRFTDTWKNIWQIRVPNVVKVFVWRACLNALPTKANLF
jgi:hypothetical protein